MFRIVFIAVGGGERETIVAADSEALAARIAAARDEFDLILSCTRLDTLEDWAVQDRRLRAIRIAA